MADEEGSGCCWTLIAWEVWRLCRPYGLFDDCANDCVYKAVRHILGTE